MQQPGFFEWLWNDAPLLIPILVLAKVGEIGILCGIVDRYHWRAGRRWYSVRLFGWGLFAGVIVGLFNLARGDDSLLFFAAGTGSFAGSGTGALIDFSQRLLDRIDPACRIRLLR